MKDKMINVFLTLTILLSFPMTSCDDVDSAPTSPGVEVEKPDKDWNNPESEHYVSGEYYDYTLTGKPERPYMLSYTSTMMMKFFMAQPDQQGGTNIYMTYEEALDNIIAIDNISRGIPKIVYLVGWQFNGHDDKYPAFSEMNEALKRPQDGSALESYMWLKEEAKKYNTIVSVHLLVNDAYTNSPLWHEYVRNDLLCRNADGSFLSWGDPLNGLVNYQVCLVNEWAKGYTQKRLDAVVEMLDITDSKTIHIDAFEPRTSPYHDVTIDMTLEVMRKVIRYLRNKGIDTTAEFWHGNTRPRPENKDRITSSFENEMFIGLQPAAWWNDMTAEERASISPDLACSGESGQFDWNIYHDIGFMFGDNMHAEAILKNTPKEERMPLIIKDFCLKTLQCMYLNMHAAPVCDTNAKTVTYSGDLVVNAAEMTVKKNGMLRRKGNDVFFPAVWIKDHKEILAFSNDGYATMSWVLPTDWGDVEKVSIRTVTERGLSDPVVHQVVERKVTLTLAAGQMVSLTPLN